MIVLSQQNMMDCTWRYENNACAGGIVTLSVCVLF